MHAHIGSLNSSVMLHAFCIQPGKESLRPLRVTPEEIEDGDSVDHEGETAKTDVESTAPHGSQHYAELEFAAKLEFISCENHLILASRNENFDVQYQK